MTGRPARCELTDLPVDGCAHCRGNTTTPDEEATAEHAALAATAPWFHAVHPGVCARCGAPFTAGTPIRMELPRGWRAACCKEGAP